MTEFYFPEMEKYGLENFLLNSPLVAGVIQGEAVPILNTSALIKKVAKGSVENPVEEFECMSVSGLMLKQILSNSKNWNFFNKLLKQDRIVLAVFTWRIKTTTHFTAVILLKKKKGWAKLHSELMMRTGAPILVDRTHFGNAVGFIFDPTPFRYFFENAPNSCRLASVVDPDGVIVPVGLSAYPLPLHSLNKKGKILLTFLKIDFPNQTVFLVSIDLGTGKHLEIRLKFKGNKLVPIQETTNHPLRSEEKFLLEGKREIITKIAKRHMTFYDKKIRPNL